LDATNVRSGRRNASTDRGRREGCGVVDTSCDEKLKGLAVVSRRANR
jgi:hypothetical protein